MSGLRLGRRARIGPMPWIVAVMVLLTLLAAAAALALDATGSRVRDGMSGRLTIQILTADKVARERQALAALHEVRRIAGVADARRVPQAELEALLEPWLGPGFGASGIAVPAMIDIDLAPGRALRPEALAEAIRLVAPDARIESHAAWLDPLDRLLGILRALAIGLVVLLAGALAGLVALAARAAFEAQRETIELLHMVGATDRQIARLFERRIGLRALAGGLGGGLLALAMLAGLAPMLADLDTGLASGMALAPAAWAVLLAIPFAGTGLAMATTRLIILRELRRTP